MTDALFSALEIPDANAPGYRLHHLEVLNWGTFHEKIWRFVPGCETSLLTGDIGSGKSTILAALLGLNIGSGLTWTGSLANLLWRRTLSRQGVTVTSWEFHRVSLALTPVSLVAGVAVLALLA